MASTAIYVILCIICMYNTNNNPTFQQYLHPLPSSKYPPLLQFKKKHEHEITRCG